MRYTTIAPEEPGYFWLKDAETEEIVEVWHDPGHPVAQTFFVHRCGSGEFAEVQSLAGAKWAGRSWLPWNLPNVDRRVVSQPKLPLSGKVACVTGSGQGIGQAIAIRLAQEGADLVVHDRVVGENALHTLGQIKNLGRRGVVVAGDLSSTAESQLIIKEGVRELGKIDILVNNVGVERRANFWEITEEDFAFVMNINVRGTFFVTQALVNHLRSTNRPGRIINISSVHEELPFPHFSTYCASKGALKMLCRNLAIELAPLGITVNNIAPGAVATPINRSLLSNPEQLKALIGNIPLGRLGEPADIAGVAAFLASDAAAYITASTVVVDGGLLWNYQEQ